MFDAPGGSAGREHADASHIPARTYFIGFRLYSPTQAYFDKVWKPGDIEKLEPKFVGGERAE